MSKRYTLETFSEKANKVHNNKYKYISFESMTKLVEIECPHHGIFLQQGGSHVRGVGCAKCTGNNKCTTEEFIEKAVKVHGDKYDYSLVKYVNAKTPVNIICKEHGVFQQKPDKHINAKHGCHKCCNGGIQLTHEEFETRAREVHGDKYQYVSEYVNMNTHMEIYCEKHGSFHQTPLNHIHDSNGCPKCISSKGEEEIRIFLEENKIYYIPQYRFDDCRSIKFNNKLPFDFYLPELNLCIEYNGIQHYEYTEYFHKTLEIFEYRKAIDQIKIDYCKNNNIPLLIIRYDEEILPILNEQLLKLNIPL